MILMAEAKQNFSSNAQRGLLALALLTCSFEIFLVVNLGFNFKVCQLAVFAAALLFFNEWLADRSRLKIPVGLNFLFISLFLSILFWPNSDLTARSIGYSLWFAFDIVGVILFFNAFRRVQHFIWLVKAVLLSVIFNSAFGLLQFTLGVVGLSPPLVTQWWIEGRLPRINGFNYEPSFYATYLTLGWVFALYLWEKKPPLIGRRLILMTAALSTLALLICSSRMGWFAMILWLLRPLAQIGIQLIRTSRISKKRMSLLGLYIAAFVLVIGTVLSIFTLDNLKVLAGGLGLFDGDSAYSARERGETTQLTAEVALNHLIIGGGFGGVPSGIAKASGGTILNLEDAKTFEGKNITFELVASLGVAGALSVYAFFFFILRAALQLSRKVMRVAGETDMNEAVFLSVTLRGLVWAVSLDLILLQLNQNFLRAYLWIFVGVLAAAVGVSLGFCKMRIDNRHRYQKLKASHDFV